MIAHRCRRACPYDGHGILRSLHVFEQGQEHASERGQNGNAVRGLPRVRRHQGHAVHWHFVRARAYRLGAGL
jgi:hypothetical protein